MKREWARVREYVEGVTPTVLGVYLGLGVDPAGIRWKDGQELSKEELEMLADLLYRVAERAQKWMYDKPSGAKELHEIAMKEVARVNALLGDEKVSSIRFVEKIDETA